MQATATTKTIEEFTDKAIRSLSDTSPYDIPFFAMYSCDQSQTPPPASQSALAPTSQFGARSHNPSAVVPASLAQIRLSLAGSIGFPSSHPSIPANVILDLNAPETQSEVDSLSSTGSTFSTDTASLDGTTIWPFKEACTKQTPVFVEELGRRGDGREKRGWEEPVRNAVVIPILEEDGSGSVTVKSVIVVGLNPRRPWDDVYATFLNLLARQLSSGLSQAQSAEQDARKRSELLGNYFSQIQFRRSDSRLRQHSTAPRRNSSPTSRTSYELRSRLFSDRLETSSPPNRRRSTRRIARSSSPSRRIRSDCSTWSSEFRVDLNPKPRALLIAIPPTALFSTSPVSRVVRWKRSTERYD